mmetsp:Transcript_1306/g.1635  ORF Transcript_1306/g.1635 Transcript_1306/m.1635 type:complete len:151 (+) Transcript_1306:2301-2753(+)
MLNAISVRMGESEEENRFIARQSSFEPSPVQQQQLLRPDCIKEDDREEKLRDPKAPVQTQESDDHTRRMNTNESLTSSTFLHRETFPVTNIGSGIVAVVSKPPLRAKSAKRKNRRSESLRSKVALSQERSSQQRYLDHIFSKKAEGYHQP